MTQKAASKRRVAKERDHVLSQNSIVWFHHPINSHEYHQVIQDFCTEDVRSLFWAVCSPIHASLCSFSSFSPPSSPLLWWGWFWCDWQMRMSRNDMSLLLYALRAIVSVSAWLLVSISWQTYLSIVSGSMCWFCVDEREKSPAASELSTKVLNDFEWARSVFYAGLSLVLGIEVSSGELPLLSCLYFQLMCLSDTDFRQYAPPFSR